MFVLRASSADADGGGLRVLERVLGFDDRDLVVDAGLVAALGDVEGVLVSRDGVGVELYQGVLAAQLEEVLGERCLLGEPLVFEVGGGDLGAVLIAADLVADLAPEIGLPAQIEGQAAERALATGRGGDGGSGRAGARAGTCPCARSRSGCRGGVGQVRGRSGPRIRRCSAESRVEL
jgi:hypothetical protein